MNIGRKRMTPDQEDKKRKFEEDIIEVAVAEYYRWVDDMNKKNPLSIVRSELDAKMFYDAMRLGVIRGINFATNQYMQSLKNFEEAKKDGSNN
jgi:hypothetical protein